MSGMLSASVIVGVMLLLMAARAPIAASMLAAGVLGYGLLAGWSNLASFLAASSFARLTNYELSVIPLFILMGSFASHGGLSRALFEFTAVVTSRFRGGLAMGAVLACAAFGAICGSSVATAATIARVAYPELRRNGYSGQFASGVLAASGTLGILIPPSVPLVVYAILTEQNIAKLFAAAMLPGLIAVAGYLLAIAVVVRAQPGHAPRHEEHRRLARATVLGVAPVAVIFLLVFGGIYAGWFNPTEGAAIGSAATLAVALARGEMGWAGFGRSLRDTAEVSAMIFLIFIGADVMNAALALTQMPVHLEQLVRGWDLPPLLVVAVILLLYVALGAVMDELSMLLLTIPIFFPVVIGLDFGLPRESVALWFGVMVLMTVGFGMLAPPVGLNVHVVNGICRDVSISQSYRGVMPFLLSDTVRTVLLLLVPSLTLALVP
jgi:C4-dicarboxylate transporter, DctM subunit